MRRRLLVCGGVMAMIALNTYAQAQERLQKTPIGAGAETYAIKRVLAGQAAAWNQGDIPGFMGGYWRSKYTEFENDSGIFQGWDDVLKRYENAYPTRAAMGQLTFSGLEIHILCRNSAYVIGKYRLDREKDHPEGVFTLIFRKFDDGWKIVNDHTTAFRASNQ